MFRLKQINKKTGLMGVLGFSLLQNINLNPESHVHNVIENHPVAATAACATVGKGACLVVKAAKASASAVNSESPNPASK